MSSPRPVPYIGVSGVVSPHEQLTLTQTAAGAGLTPDRALLLGVKAVHKTQFLDVDNKYGRDWYPVGADAFTTALTPRDHGRTTMAVAQLYLDVDHVGDRTYRDQFMTRVFTRGNPWITGVQFDMLPWHSDPAMPAFLEDLKSQHDTTVLLQCHGPAMSELGPAAAIAALGRLAPVIDYVLFDSSHGTGTSLDVDVLTPFLEGAYSASTLDAVGIAVAGGLTARGVQDTLGQLLTRFPDLSWDAEGGLHPLTTDGTRPLDLDTAGRYLRASAQLLTNGQAGPGG